MRRSMLLLACVLAAGCAHEEVSSAESLSCSHSLEEFCADTPENCLRHRSDWNDVSPWCARPGAAGESFSAFSCGDIGGMALHGPVFNGEFYYVGGNLVAVVDFARGCLAGPPVFVRPASCTSNNFGLFCGRQLHEPDAASDAGAPDAPRDADAG
jgi:hypothetical protein